MDTFHSFSELQESQATNNMASFNMSPKVDSYAGYDFFVLSDDHTPPHVHVFKGDSDLGKLPINPVDTGQENADQIPAGDLRKLKKRIKKRSNHYLQEWNKHHPPSGDSTYVPK